MSSVSERAILGLSRHLLTQNRYSLSAQALRDGFNSLDMAARRFSPDVAASCSATSTRALSNLGLVAIR